MGYPASKFEAIYRNDIKDVAEYLDSKYYNKYYIVNLTEDVYDDTPFGNRVIHFGFPDHTPPPFDLLLSVVIFLDLWMSQSDDNIVAVHCLAGKGRTGVIISSLLVYLWYKAGCCHTYDEVALSVSNYFTSERKEGIESINQLNSVYEFSYYCHKLFNHLDKSITTNYVSAPTILLQNVIINTLFTKEELYLVIYTHNSKQTKLVKKNTMWYYPNDVKMNEMASELTFELNLVLSDDISIEFFVNNRTKNIFLGRYMNNTRFLDYNLNYIKLKNSNIDVSDTTLEHRKFTHYFSLTMNYSPILNNLEESWAIPPSILNSSKEPAGSFRIFKDDMDRILCNTSNPDYSIPKLSPKMRISELSKSNNSDANINHGMLHLLDDALTNSNSSFNYDVSGLSLRTPIIGELYMYVRWKGFKKHYVVMEFLRNSSNHISPQLKIYKNCTTAEPCRVIILREYEEPVVDFRSQDFYLMKLESKIDTSEVLFQTKCFQSFLSWLKSIQEAQELIFTQNMVNRDYEQHDDNLLDFYKLFKPDEDFPKWFDIPDNVTQRKNLIKRLRKKYNLTKSEFKSIRYNRINTFLPDQPLRETIPYRIKHIERDQNIKKCIHRLSIIFGDQINALGILCYLCPFNVVYSFLLRFFSLYHPDQLIPLNINPELYIDTIVKYYLKKM